MPFYAVGPLRIIPARDIGSAGPSEGPSAVVECPLRDSLRSVYPWFVLFGLMLLRPSNRNRRAWAVFLPLLAIYGILHVVENRPDGPMTWYVSMYIRSFVCEAMRSLALGLALLVAVSDLISVRSALLRRILALGIVLSGGVVALSLNAPIAMNSVLLVVAFAVIVLVSAFGLGVIALLLRWLLGRHDLRWHAGIYFAICAGPILLIQGAGLLLLGGAHEQLSTRHQITMAGIVSQVLFAPYFVFLCFALLALLSPVHRQRLLHCFAKDPMRPPDTQRCAP